MTSQPVNYRGYRLIISYAVWLYYRFGLSFRDVEDLLHLLRAAHHRLLRTRAFGVWDEVTRAC